MRSATVFAASLVLAASLCPVSAAETGAEAPSNAGYLYGTVTTKVGKSHTGILRWDGEEAFWDDLFHSAKTDLPYGDYAEPPEPDEDEVWWQRMARIIGDEMGVHEEGRVVAVRFGDLERVEPTGGDSAVLTLRGGATIEVEGYANDVGAEIEVRDDKPGSVEVPWRHIDSIVFSAAPSDVDPGSFRLHGTVTTRTGDFVGFIQWDSQESLSTDRLDGDVDGERVSLEMGEIRSIERQTSRSAAVTLASGEKLVLSGTNDVNSDIRGIHIEDDRFGRVEVGWRDFVRVVFDDPGTSGRGYDSYAPAAELSGRVELTNGDWRTGRLVFDLDEQWGWEMLDGSSGGIDFTVPFAMVERIEPDGDRTNVTLRNGMQLELEDSHDVGRSNSGLVVIPKTTGEPAHVPWRDVAAVELD